ncbi:MAG: hypothetical protein QW688_10000, partial [Thermoprotei archaeon]
ELRRRLEEEEKRDVTNRILSAIDSVASFSFLDYWVAAEFTDGAIVHWEDWEFPFCSVHAYDPCEHNKHPIQYIRKVADEIFV